MDKAVKDHLLNQLEELTSTMDIPSGRRKDFRWLMRNAFVRNSDHPNLVTVNWISTELLKGHYE